MEEGTARCDPPVEASSALAGEDLKYWAAHPELPALVSHFMAKGDNSYFSGFRPQCQ